MMSLKIFVFACLAVSVLSGPTIEEKALIVFSEMDLWNDNDKLGGRERAKFYKRSDCDDNEELSGDEMLCIGKYIDVGDSLWTFLKNADSNDDEILQREEYRAFLDGIDSNANGRITWTEFSLAWNSTFYGTN